MLAALTTDPHGFGTEQLRPVLAAGVRPSGVEHAVLVGGFLFAIQNWLVDAFGCDIPRDKAHRTGQVLNLVGRRKVTRKAGEPDAFAGRIPDEVERLVEAVRAGPGASAAELRCQVEAWVAGLTGAVRDPATVPDGLDPYLRQVAERAADVTDEEVEGLKVAVAGRGDRRTDHRPRRRGRPRPARDCLGRPRRRHRFHRAPALSAQDGTASTDVLRRPRASAGKA